MSLPGGVLEPVPPDPDAAGFVLAGGQSSRMGQDKALLPLAGNPLLVHSLAILREAGLPASIAGARSSLTAYAPVIQDPEPDRGPLAGLCAALASTSARHAVVLSVDLPLLPASLLAYMLSHAQRTGRPVTLASVNGYAQTFPAILDRAVLPILQAQLAAGHGGCFDAFQAASASLGQPLTVLPAELLAQSGHVFHPRSLPTALWFLNVNTPADFRVAAAFGPARIA